jgi:hypothetical protein
LCCRIVRSVWRVLHFRCFSRLVQFTKHCSVWAAVCARRSFAKLDPPEMTTRLHACLRMGTVQSIRILRGSMQLFLRLRKRHSKCSSRITEPPFEDGNFPALIVHRVSIVRRSWTVQRHHCATLDTLANDDVTLHCDADRFEGSVLRDFGAYESAKGGEKHVFTPELVGALRKNGALTRQLRYLSESDCCEGHLLAPQSPRICSTPEDPHQRG